MKDLLIITNNPKRASYRQRIEIYLNGLWLKGVDYRIAKLPSGLLARRRLFRQASDFRCVLLHKKCLNYFDVSYLRSHARKLVYDFDDAIMYSPKSPGSNRTSHFALFRRMAKVSDVIIAGNSYLAEHAGKFNGNVKVLPTGLNVASYDVSGKVFNDDKVRLVWIGSRSTLGYLEQIRAGLEELGRGNEKLVLKIICDDFLDFENLEVEKCRWSLENQCIDLASGDIGLAPLPDNRFTLGKCGFKILQYQAAGLPVVASPVGVNSAFVEDGKSGYLATDIGEWVERISALIENAELRKRMGGLGRGHVAKFDSGVIGEKLFGLITESIGKPLSCYSGKAVKSPAVSLLDLPVVSICIPTYNRREYLKETIDSILAQTYRDYEIVIVDDGSTDGTGEMIDALDVPVTYHWQENSGDAATRNKLVELAKGKYVSFIDSDDLLVPDAIERMVDAMEAEAEDVIVYGSYYRIDEYGNVYGKCKRKLYSGKITKQLFQTILVHSCGSMFPKKVLQAFPAFDTSLKVCSDYDLWLRLSVKYSFVALVEPTFKRRRHSDNLSETSFENCFTEFRVLRRFYYENGGKELVPEEIAMRVFSKEGRRAGRCARKEGLHEQACQLLTQSFEQNPNFKSMLSLMRARLARQLGILQSALK